MKKLIIVFAVLFVGLSACQESESPTPSPQLSVAEVETLIFTREEEKLAFDVYSYAFEQYGITAFQNIAKSETQHIQSVLRLMASYGISDPLNGDQTLGKFTDPALQLLFKQLKERVDLSESEAVKVGLLIEDMDIYDLQMGILETDKALIQALYQSLMCGSENHMRSFYNLATQAGIDYSPEYISLSEYNQIINSSRTSCNSNF